MVVDGRGKLENKQIFYIIDTINEAINEAINWHKKIRFRKIEYNVKKERVLHHGGEKYTFSPTPWSGTATTTMWWAIRTSTRTSAATG